MEGGGKGVILLPIMLRISINTPANPQNLSENCTLSVKTHFPDKSLKLPTKLPLLICKEFYLSLEMQKE